MSLIGHFAPAADDHPVDRGFYVDPAAIDPVEAVPGIDFRLFRGRRMLANLATLQPHASAPVHAHEEEQIFVVVSGEVEFDLDGDVRALAAGQMVMIPAWVPHGARTGSTGCVGLDVFSPPRSTLMELVDDTSPHAVQAIGGLSG